MELLLRASCSCHELRQTQNQRGMRPPAVVEVRGMPAVWIHSGLGSRQRRAAVLENRQPSREDRGQVQAWRRVLGAGEAAVRQGAAQAPDFTVCGAFSLWRHTKCYEGRVHVTSGLGMRLAILLRDCFLRQHVQS